MVNPLGKAMVVNAYDPENDGKDGKNVKTNHRD